MNKNKIAFLIYGESSSGRDALTEEKYKDLAAAFIAEGFGVQSVLYNDDIADQLATSLLSFDAVLVWVNPVEKGNNRKKLDTLLMDIYNKGCFVSTHPEVILKMGTKEILFATKDMEWGGDVELYMSFEDFTNRFPGSLLKSKTRVLKQYRGNGGNGVFKVSSINGNRISVTHAIAGNETTVFSTEDFYKNFNPFFLNDGMLIDQEWNKNITNGMVRCYLTGTKVAGFGYQEINALYVSSEGNYIPPGKRYYFTQHCGLFNDLKLIMENKWAPQLQQQFIITDNMMPVIWDADFFINNPNSNNAAEKYSLCEINVSCVSPFPASAIPFMVEEVKNRINS